MAFFEEPKDALGAGFFEPTIKKVSEWDVGGRAVEVCTSAV